MRCLLFAAVLVGASLMMTSRAEAQYVYRAYYAPAPVVTYYSAPAGYAAPAPYYSTYRPVAPAYYAAPAPAYYGGYGYYGRPAVTYYSGYGGYEVRVPGQPIRNAFRAVIP